MENYTVKKLTFDSIIIEMDAAKLDAHNQVKMFGKGFQQVTPDDSLIFIQEEDFIFDINTLLYLDIDPGFRLLKKGCYPIKIAHGKIQLLVTLSPYR